MPRKAAPAAAPPTHDWYLQDWMKTLRVSQARLADLVGWSKATMNDIYHGRTSYYRQILNDVAHALHVQPYELLMHPDDAMAIRSMQRNMRVLQTTRSLADPDEELPIAATGGA